VISRWLLDSLGELAFLRAFSLAMDKLFWLIPGSLAGRPGPDEEPWDSVSLRNGGIGAVLSVNDGHMCHAQEFAALDIAYACFPLSDWVPPQPGDRELCLNALPQAYAFVESQMKQGKRVVVHCSGGNDRTGLFLSYYLVRHAGMSAHQAIQAVRNVRPTVLSAQGWEVFAREILSEIRS
jgi:protein-tyrosine phosphatase